MNLFEKTEKKTLNQIEINRQRQNRIKKEECCAIGAASLRQQLLVLKYGDAYS